MILMNWNNEDDTILLNKIKKINWRQYNGPRAYSHRKVYLAFEDMVLLREEKNKWKVTSDFKFALGNDQGSTYYPAVLSALPLLIEIILNSRYEAVRNSALEVLCDWSSSFEPELGSYPGITTRELQLFVRTAINDFAAQDNKEESSRNRELVADIREYLLK